LLFESMDNNSKKELVRFIVANNNNYTDCQMLKRLAEKYGEINGTKLQYEAHIIPHKSSHISCSLTAIWKNQKDLLGTRE
ncbi:hypothetical protein LCGC14_2541210, partial [marine sediment metagenome]